MKIITRQGVSLEVVEDGPSDGMPLVMITGTLQTIVDWPGALIDDLVKSGYRVVRFDNRDAGLSQTFASKNILTMIWILFWAYAFGIPPYTLTDMAEDAVGIMDALNIQSAHVIGWSMGGIIAQRLALKYPERVRLVWALISRHFLRSAL